MKVLIETKDGEGLEALMAYINYEDRADRFELKFVEV